MEKYPVNEPWFRGIPITHFRFRPAPCLAPGILIDQAPQQSSYNDHIVTTPKETKRKNGCFHPLTNVSTPKPLSRTIKSARFLKVSEGRDHLYPCPRVPTPIIPGKGFMLKMGRAGKVDNPASQKEEKGSIPSPAYCT